MSARKARQPKAPTLATRRRKAVERAFPGVMCKRVAFECAHRPASNDHNWSGFTDGKRYSLNLTVEASAETLVRHELVEQEEIDSLPPSGCRSGLKKTNRGTYQASVCYFEHFDTPTIARDMAAKIGISHPRHKVYSGGSWRMVEPEKAEPSNVIPFPKKNPRATDPVRAVIATMAMNEDVAIVFPPDVPIKTLGLALACMDLRLETVGGKLVVRRVGGES